MHYVAAELGRVVLLFQFMPVRLGVKAVQNIRQMVVFEMHRGLQIQLVAPCL